MWSSSTVVSRGERVMPKPLLLACNLPSQILLLWWWGGGLHCTLGIWSDWAYEADLGLPLHAHWALQGWSIFRHLGCAHKQSTMFNRCSWCLQVQAMSGASDPMVATSDTPGNDGSTTAPTDPASNGNGIVSVAAPLDSSNSADRTRSRTNGGSDESSSTFAECADIPAPGSFSCSEQKGWGKCSEDFFVQNNYCAATCGRCGGGSHGKYPFVQSSQGPSTSGGRKLLRLAHSIPCHDSCTAVSS